MAGYFRSLPPSALEPHLGPFSGQFHAVNNGGHLFPHHEPGHNLGPTPHHPASCKCCQRLQRMGKNSFVEVSRCCEHDAANGVHHQEQNVVEVIHHDGFNNNNNGQHHFQPVFYQHQRPSSHYLPPHHRPHQEKQVTVTAVVPEKALSKPGVTLHLEAKSANRNHNNNHGLIVTRPPPCHQPEIIIRPNTAVYIEPPTLTTDSSRSDDRFIHIGPACYPQPEIRPSVEFVETGNRDNFYIANEFQPRPGMSDFIKDYRCREQYANNARSSSLFRSLSQSNLLRGQPTQRQPQSEIALRNCRRWYH